MTTYEDQLKKWASKRCDIPVVEIVEVTLIPEFDYSEGCPTCGPETSEMLNLTVYGQGSRGRSKILYQKSINIKYGENFAETLKEIIEA